MQTSFNKDLQGWLRPAQRMLGSRLVLVPNTEWKDYNVYAFEEHPGLQLKVYYYAQIQYLWKGRPVPTGRNTEEDQRLVLKWGIESPLPWTAMSPQAVQEALAFAQKLDKK